MIPGIYDDLDSETYHNLEGLSSTGVSLMLDCPKRYHWEYFIERPLRTDKQVKESNDKFVIGRAVHTLVLEEHKFKDLFYVMSENVNRTKKVDKEIYAAAETEANGRQIIRAKDWSKIHNMAQALSEHPRFEEMKGGKIENSIFWKNKSPFYESLLKSRPDIYTDNIILDIKTTDSINKFKYTFHQLGYHRQAAMQFDSLYRQDGIKRHFGFLVVEKKEPYLTAAFTLGLEEMEQGRLEYCEAADLYAECLKYNSWPAYEAQYQSLIIPKWKLNREENYHD